MKLRRLAIERLEGIDRPFELTDLASGLNIVVGPNGIGKSRLCAAVRALLWHERGVSSVGFTADALFEHEGAAWHVERDGSSHVWQRDGLAAAPPTLPGERLDACFFLGLRDLLDDSDRAGGDLASEIRRQMSGGFDLDSVGQAFEGAIPARVGQREQKALEAAQNEIRKAERGQGDVQAREGQLVGLEAQAAAAGRAQNRLVHFKTALCLQALRSEHAQRTRELTELPRALANLDGKELARLDKLEQERLEKLRERETAERSLSQAIAAARATQLDEPIDPVSLTTWRARAEKLADVERQLEAMRLEVASATQALASSRRSLGAPDEAAAGGILAYLEAGLSIQDDCDLFGFLRESHAHATKTEAVRERLRLLGARVFSEEEAQRLELLKRGVSPLRTWLRAPDPEAQVAASALWPSRSSLVVVGLSIAVIGPALRFLTPAWGVAPWLVLGMGVGLVGAGWLVRIPVDRSRAKDWRAIAVEQFPDAIDPPAAWSRDLVDARLDRLEDEIARHDANEKRARDRGVEHGQLRETLNGLEARGHDLEEQRRVLIGRLGLDATRPDVEMVDLARALDQVRNAEIAAGKATAKLEELEAFSGQILSEIVASHRLLGASEPTDSASARAGVYFLDERDRALRGSTRDRLREEQTCDRLDREIERLEVGKAELFAVAELETQDRAQLARLLRELDRFTKLRSDSVDLKTQIDRAVSDLELAGEVALAKSSLLTLREQEAVLLKASEARDDLFRQIGEIKALAGNAREGHVLEEAIARKDAALRALGDRRVEALSASAGKFLIDQIRREHETNQMPRVLERARERFGAFTHQRYELKVSAADGGAFVAVEARSGKGLSPDKLSDGTRAQLILAVRLAFAEEAEQGADLPIFLDEAMDHSDPERFHAIARSLARMIDDEGRQIFYLSNDPTDIERFRSAFEVEDCHQIATIDLAAVRGREARVEEREVLRVEPLRSVPMPAGASAEEYGVVIGTSVLEPSRGPFAQHVFHVLRDDLSLLHEFLEARVESVGQCRNALRSGSAFAKAIIAGNAVAANLDVRIELFETFCLAWCEGRGRPVGRSEIEKSQAVTDRFLDAFLEIAAEQGGRASRILAAIQEPKDPRLRGYRKDSADRLERFLETGGYIDDDEAILSESEIVERAIGSPAANRLSPKIAAELVHQWWSSSLDASRGKAPGSAMG